MGVEAALSPPDAVPSTGGEGQDSHFLGEDAAQLSGHCWLGMSRTPWSLVSPLDQVLPEKGEAK